MTGKYACNDALLIQCIVTKMLWTRLACALLLIRIVSVHPMHVQALVTLS